jgi:hypothetical protein
MSKARQTCTVLLQVIDVKDRDSARHVFDLLGQQTIIFQDHKPVNGFTEETGACCSANQISQSSLAPDAAGVCPHISNCSSSRSVPCHGSEAFPLD